MNGFAWRRALVSVTIAASLTLHPTAFADAGSDCPADETELSGLLDSGIDAAREGRLGKAERRLRRAADCRPLDHPRGLEALDQLAWVLGSRRRTGELRDVYRSALDRVDASTPAGRALRGELLARQSAALAEVGKIGPALEAARESAAIARQLRGRDGGAERLARSLAVLGRLEDAAGQLDAARASYAEFVALLGPEPTKALIGVADRLAALQAAAGDLDAAEGSYALALESFRLRYTMDFDPLVALVQEIRRTGRDQEAPGLVALADDFAARERAEGEREEHSGRPTDPDRLYVAGTDGVIDPEKIAESHVSPEFPVRARAERVEGEVVLSAVIARDGRVGIVEVESCTAPGHGFEEAAIEAVRRWRYEPATRDGVPVAVKFEVTVSYFFR